MILTGLLSISLLSTEAKALSCVDGIYNSNLKIDAGEMPSNIQPVFWSTYPEAMEDICGIPANELVAPSAPEPTELAGPDGSPP